MAELTTSPGQSGYKSQLERYKAQFKRLIHKYIGNAFSSDREIPEEGDEGVSSFIYTLWDESRKWRQSSFNRMGYNDPVEFIRLCRLLEQGMHWEVWPPKEDWQEKLVDNEIGNQVRTRKSYMTANVHDVTIMPNIKNLDTVLEQERDESEYADVIMQGVMVGLTEGTAIFHSYLDALDTNGLARERLLSNASIFPTPRAVGIKRSEGSWYLAIATLETEQSLVEQYADFDPSEASDPSADFLAAVDPLYPYNKALAVDSNTYTRHFDKIEVFLDDPTIIDDPFDPEEAAAEHEAVGEGISIEPDENENHAGHIEAHVRYLQELETSQDYDEQQKAMVSEVLGMHVQDHIAYVSKALTLGKQVGKRKKYPNGRHIVRVGGQIVVDKAVVGPHDWRKYFSIWYNERVADSWWGRGVPEVLWKTNETEDNLLSRMSDISITTSMPKMYFDVADKENIEENGLDNDPRTPGFTTQPPVHRQGSPVRELPMIYNIMKQDAQKQLGISDVTYGKSPGANTSGKMVQILLRQNVVLVTGEANLRLLKVVENLMEARIALMQQFYITPKIYFIDGEPVPVTVSELMKQWEIVDPVTQSVATKRVTKIQIRVRPNSNFPERFEYELSFLLELAQMRHADGMTYLPREAVLDYLAQRWPNLGRKGKYYQISEATKVGAQVMAQEEARNQEQNTDLRKVANAFKQQGIRTLTGNQSIIEGKKNGEKPVEAAET